MKLAINTFKASSYAAIFKLSGLIKISFLLGSHMIWFSGVNCILPLSGAFGGTLGASLLFLVRQLIHLLFYKTFSLSFLAFCIPGFFASLYWSNRHWLIHVVTPLVCIGLFILHPIGGQVWFYSLYWLIPVAIYFVPRENLFLQALGSTFIAHAVGSAIWCYTVPMTQSMWLSLLPIVIVERVLFALGMVMAHYAISSIFEMINYISKKTFGCSIQSNPSLT